MTKRPVRFSRLFDQRLGELVAEGQLPLLRAQSLEDATNELRDNPLASDGLIVEPAGFYWVKSCRTSDGKQTGLWVAYMPTDDGAVYLEDLFIFEG